MFLMALALSFCACAKLPEFPAEFIFEADMQSKVCGKWKIIDKERLLVEHVQDLPLEKCHGIFGFSVNDMPKVLDWSRVAITEMKKVNK